MYWFKFKRSGRNSLTCQRNLSQHGKTTGNFQTKKMKNKEIFRGLQAVQKAPYQKRKPSQVRSPKNTSYPCLLPTTPPPKRLLLWRNVAVLVGYTSLFMPTLCFSRRSVLLKPLITGCWLFGNRCFNPAKDWRHQTGRKVERDWPFLPQTQL